MKKILLIGKIDEKMNALSAKLSEHYIVRFGSSVPLAVFGILDGFRPDLIAARSSETESSVLERIKTRHPSIPLVLLGSGDEAGAAAVCEDEKEAVCGVIYRLLPYEQNDTQPQMLTLLAVDDDASMLRMLKVMLDSEYSVMLSPSGRKAFAMMARRKPDVILLDYEMPDLNGLQTLELIRSEAGYADIPVIFLTGTDTEGFAESVRSAGAAGYIVKPAGTKAIKAAIKSALEAAQGTEDAV